jgi:peptide deformylase
MIRPILRYGDAALHARARPVETFDQALHQLLSDMAETMYAAPGVGLAAPQIGVPLRAVVIDVTVGKKRGELHELVNPVLVSCEGMQMEEEGCLSLPGFNATVVRPTRAVVKAMDRDGRDVVIEGTDLLARALQHELDHLEGSLFVDRLRGIRRDVIVRKVQRLRRAGKW